MPAWQIRNSVLDAKGREWTVTRRFLPWRRVIEPLALATFRYRRRALTPPPRPAKHDGGKKPRGEVIFEAVLTPILSPHLIFFWIFIALVFVVLLPLAALELLAQLAAGGVLAAARALGWARYRVDVIGHTGRDLHSESIILLRDGRRARELVDTIRAEREGAERPFRPDGIEVAAHRSVWQPAEEWV